jgi:hypothetical protein
MTKSTTNKTKGNKKMPFKKHDRVKINEDLYYTSKRFGTSEDMFKVLTGTITNIGRDYSIYVKLDNISEMPYIYDSRDLNVLD